MWCSNQFNTPPTLDVDSIPTLAHWRTHAHCSARPAPSLPPLPSLHRSPAVAITRSRNLSADALTCWKCSRIRTLTGRRLVPKSAAGKSKTAREEGKERKRQNILEDLSIDHYQLTSVKVGEALVSHCLSYRCCVIGWENLKQFRENVLDAGW